jgi:hypothetical protein
VPTTTISGIPTAGEPGSVRGIPPRGWRLPCRGPGEGSFRGDCGAGPKRGTRVALEGKPRWVMAGSTSNASQRLKDDDEDGAIQEFYGQLWFVPGDSPPAAISGKRSRVRYGGEKVSVTSSPGIHGLGPLCQGVVPPA